MKKIFAVFLLFLNVHVAWALTPAQQVLLFSAACPQNVALSGLCPSVDLNFATNQYYVNGVGLVPATSLLSITRAQTVNSYAQTVAGVLTPFAANTLRITDNGLLIEESRVNLILQSQFAATWGSSRSSNNASAIAAPDPAFTATQIVEDSTASATHTTTQNITKAASSLAYTLTVYAKANTRTRIAIQASNGANGQIVGFDLAGGQIAYGPTAVGSGWAATAQSITAVSNGFYRCVFSVTSDATTAILFAIFLDNGSGTAAQSTSYSGNGASGAYIWGAQVEQAAFPTSYIPTTTVSVTRNADNILPLGLLLTIMTATQGSFVVSLPSGVSQGGVPLNRSSSPNDKFILFSGTTISRSLVGSAGVASATIGGGGTIASALKLGHAFNASGISNVANNGTVATSASTFSVAEASKQFIGSNGVTASNYIDGYLGRLSAFNSKLPDATLKALTQ